MLMEVVDPEPLTGDHVPFRKETWKSELWKEREGWLWKKGDSVSQKRLSPVKRSVLSTRVSQPSAAGSWCVPFPTSATRDPTAFPSWYRSLKGIAFPASHSETEELKHEGMEGETVVVPGRVGPERRISTVDGENRMLIEVVDLNL
jgi:hypothetical protein